jgi:hypothetical protein
MDFDISSPRTASGFYLLLRIKVLIMVCGHIDVSHRIAEFIRLRLLQFDGSFADHIPFVPTATGGLQVAEDPFQQF